MNENAISTPARRGRPQKYSTAQMSVEIKAVAIEVQGAPTIRQFNDSEASAIPAYAIIARHGGSWSAALKAEGMTAHPVGRPRKSKACKPAVTEHVAAAIPAAKPATVADAAAIVMSDAAGEMAPAAIAREINTRGIGNVTAATVRGALHRAVKAGKMAKGESGYMLAA